MRSQWSSASRGKANGYFILKGFADAATCDAMLARAETATIPLAVQLVRNRGTILLAGLKHFQPVDGLITDLIVLRQLTLVGGAGYTSASMRTAVELLVSDRFNRASLVGEVVTLDTLGVGMALLARSTPGRDSVHVSLKHT